MLVNLSDKKVVSFSFEYEMKVTHCIFFVGEIKDGKIIWEDEFSEKATCSDKDIFSKKVGKKISLLRAMIGNGLSKEERKIVWEVYLQKTKNRKEKEKEIVAYIHSLSSVTLNEVYEIFKASGKF